MPAPTATGRFVVSHCVRLGLGLLLALGLGAGHPALAAPPGPDDHIVLLADGGSAPDEAVEALAAAHGLEVRHVYRASVRGFAGAIPPVALKALRTDPRVRAVYRDLEVAFAPNRHTPQPQQTTAPAAQVVPAAVRRVGAAAQGAQPIDGVDRPLNVDIAILDTGVELNHPDLRVAGGACFTGENATGADNHGHGTFVAGIAAARDDARGVVGVCAGARIWSVKVLRADGSGALSDVMAGVDWVADLSKHPPIAVANLSLTADDPGAAADPLHPAIQAAFAKGTVFTCAAGNEGDPAAAVVPARYDEVIAVSALCDTDGVAGGLGAPSRSNGTVDADDTFADFSNHGAAVDIIAPGVDVQSTYLAGTWAVGSGTSFAAPLVAGAVALYRLAHPADDPVAVRAAILGLARPAPAGGWRPGASPAELEPLLDVSSFAPAPPGVHVAARLDRALYARGAAAQEVLTVQVSTETGTAIARLAPTAFVVDVDGAAAAATLRPDALPGTYGGALAVSTLLAGAHEIEVSVTDARGFVGTGRARFEVVEGGIPGTGLPSTTASAPATGSAGAAGSSGGGGGGGGCAAGEAGDADPSALTPWLALLGGLLLLSARRAPRSG